MSTITSAAPPVDPWAPVDPLGEALHFLRMSGVFYTRSEFTAPWGLDLPPLPDSLMFHVVTSGACRLEVEGADPIWLQPGSFVLVPHGEGHVLRSDADSFAAPLFDLHREMISERYEILRHGEGGAPTNMICGAVRLDHPAARSLVQLLPRTILINAWKSPHMDWIQSSLRLMALESEALRPGGETIVTRLADVLVIQAIRSWMEEDPAAQSGWLGALQDPQIGRALLCVHREPQTPWTVRSLAESVAMSRSAFAARFTELVGETPMQYVRRWKMQLAVSWLQEEGVTVYESAERLGYESEASFSRAFKRVMGVSPGSMSRRAKASP